MGGPYGRGEARADVPGEPDGEPVGEGEERLGVVCMNASVVFEPLVVVAGAIEGL